jgi:protein-disulfide isomerase
VLNLRPLAPLVFAATLAALGCHAQVPGSTIELGKPLPLSISRRVEVLVRQKAQQIPPGATIAVSAPTTSEFPGYDSIGVTISADGQTSRPIAFLVSTNGKTLAQLSKYDIAADPRDFLSADGRPARGGPPTAPVIIVGFDDLECPYCARLHSTIFPAITNRYGDKVRIVYKDFPLEQHPWALRAAIDVNCLAAQSSVGYWKVVDAIHAHASEIGTSLNPAPTPLADEPKEDKTLARANEQLDKIVREEGKNEHVDEPKLEACIAKQDTTEIDASKKIATGLSIESTPTLFINGDKIDGALPIEFLFHVIDDALRAENVTPPPPYVAPKPAAPAGTVAPPASR